VLDAAKEAVANLQAEMRAWEDRAELVRKEHREKWLANELPRVKEARDLLSKALKKGGVISRDSLPDITRMLHVELSDFQVGHTLGAYRERKDQNGNHEKIVAYQGVIKLLEAQEGDGEDVLSISALKSLGINKLGDLFRAAADKGGSVDKAPI
jgi:hypothetical protein